MADQFVAEVRAFPFNFAPTGWAMCNGQLMPIAANTALFSLIGTYYGGNGSSNFGLPNLMGNIAIGQGQGPGLNDYVIGESGGSGTVTLLTNEMPLHNHTLMADTKDSPDNASPALAALSTNANTKIYSDATNPLVQFSPQALTPAGSGFPHNNLMPFLTLNFCIALQGIFPARS